MSYTGQRFTMSPSPGGYIAGQPVKNDGTKNTSTYEPDRYNSDGRLAWADKAESLLEREREQVTTEMARAWGMFTGQGHWSKSRPKWKVRATINYCFWVPTQWAATLADNNPKVTFSAYNRKDQKEADIMTAAWNEVAVRRGWQGVIRNAILISRVEKKSFLRLTYDPWLNGGDGDMVLTAVPGMQVYVNGGATSIDDAEMLMFKDEKSLGELLQKYPEYEKQLRRYVVATADKDESQADVSSPSSSWTQPSSGATKYMPPYGGSNNPPKQSSGSAGIPVREFWTRPKGPKAECVVDSIVFNAGNLPANTLKLIEYENGEVEHMQTIITEGNIVYELPYSVVELLKFAEDLGGIRVIDSFDAVDVYYQDKRVNMYPGGRLMVRAGDTIVDDGMNPFTDGDWPFIPITSHPDPMNFWGLSDIDLIYELNEYINRLYSLFLDAALLTANPIWRIPMSSEMSDEDITNAPGAVQREDIATLKLGKREQGPEMPAYLMQVLNFGIERIKEISGLSEIATGGGKQPKGQSSAEAISLYQEAAGIRFKDAQHDIERAIVRLGYQFKGRVAQFYTSPRIARIKNAAGIDEPVTFFGTDITTPMVMEIKSGSMMPNSPTARLQYMMQLASNPKSIVDLKEIWNLLQEVGLIDSATALERRITEERSDPTRQWMVSMPPAAGGGKGAGQPKKVGSTRQNSPKSQ